MARGAQIGGLTRHMGAALSPGYSDSYIYILQTSPAISFQNPKSEHLLGAPKGQPGSCLYIYSKLLPQDLAKAFQQEAQALGKERLLLSAAVPATRKDIDAEYKVNKIVQWVSGRWYGTRAL